MSCPACFQGFVHDGEPRGYMGQLGELPAYFASPANVGESKGVVLLLTDIFGVSFVNNRLLADTIAANGLYVIVPDILAGSPVSPDALSFMESERGGILGGLSFVGGLLWNAPSLIGWMRAHGDDVTLPLVSAAAASARTFADEKGLKLGASGYCFGGRYAAMLAGPAGVIDAVSLVHASSTTKEQLAAMTKPTLFAVPEKEFMLTPKLAEAALNAIADKPDCKGSRLIVYEGVGHGFACRGGPSTTTLRAKCAADVAAFFEEMLR
jgi:dienelactone hydrolase